jgi:hypothetical protein
MNASNARRYLSSTGLRERALKSCLAPLFSCSSPMLKLPACQHSQGYCRTSKEAIENFSELAYVKQGCSCRGCPVVR